MPNPFDTLGKPAEAAYDEWAGAFSCQTKDCYDVARIARYYPGERVLKWTPPCGHVSKMEDVNE